MSNFMKRSLYILLSLVLLMGFTPFGSLNVQAAESNVTVDWNTTYQTNDGIGGCFAFNKGNAMLQLEEFAPDVSEKLWNLMFDHETGVGFNIVRTIMGDGGVSNATTKAQTWGTRFYDGASDTIEPEEGQWVWQQDDWATVKQHWDEGQVRAMKEAWDAGVRTFYVDAWSTPYWMKQNNSILGGRIKEDTDPNLPAGKNKKYYKAYADYMVQLVLFYQREYGIEITHVGPSNESDGSNTSYSQMQLSAAQLSDLYINYCIPAFEQAKADGLFKNFAKMPTLAGPEGTNYSATFNTYSSVMSDPRVYGSEMFNTFTTHIYGSAPSAPLVAPNSNHPAWLSNYKSIWQSEYMDRSGNSSANDATQRYTAEGITDGTKWANLITNLFCSNPAYTAYLNWWLVGTNGADGSDLIRLCTTGSPQAAGGGTLTGEYKLFKRFYTIGHFSRFIDPGYVRIDATRVPVPNTNIIAYKNTENGDFTINVTNNGESSTANTLSFDLKNFPYEVSGMTVFRTSADENMRKLGEIPVVNGKFELNLPSNCVVTLVPTGKPKSRLPGLDTNRDIFSTLEAERDDSGSIQALSADGSMVEMKNGDALVFKNINFQEGSANGGIVKRHMLFMQPVGTLGTGGILEARIGSASGPLVAEWTLAPGTSSIPAAFTLVDTGEQGAYGIKDLYITAKGDNAAGTLFTIDRMEFGENNYFNTAYSYPKNAVSNQGFGTNTTGWTAEDSRMTLTRSTNQNYSDIGTAGTGTNGYGLLLTRPSADAGLGVYTTLTASTLTAGQRYKLIGMVMPDAVNTSNTDENKLSQAPHTATAYLVYMNGTTEISRELIATRDNLTRLPARHSGGAAGVAAPGFSTPYSPYAYDPYNWCPPGWYELTGTVAYNPPEGTTTARLLITVDGDRMFAIDEVRFQPSVDKNELIKALNTVNAFAEINAEFAKRVAAVKAAASAMIIDTAVTQAQVDAQADIITALINDTPFSLTLNVATTANLVKKGEYFDVTASFPETTTVNAVSFVLNYDPDKFEYCGNLGADPAQNSYIDGMTYLTSDVTGGSIKLTMMIPDYKAKDLVSLRFRAKESADIRNADNSISATANLVYKTSEGSKYVFTVSGSTEFTSSGNPGDTDEDGKVTLLDLSNVIDMFGVKSGDALWTKAKFYDFNKNKVIDIADIVTVAKLIF